MNEPVRKNVIIAEILYIIFLHYKGLGHKYHFWLLKNDMIICLALLDVMQKQSVNEDEISIINKGIEISRKYCPKQDNSLSLSDLYSDELLSIEPLNRMKNLIKEILVLLKNPFNKIEVCKRFFSLHNLPRAYLSKSTYYLLDHKAALSVKDAMEYSFAYGV